MRVAIHREKGVGLTPSLPAFATFFADNRDAVYRYLVVRVGRVDAEDCFQETFVSALRAYPTVRPDSQLRAWVMKIAENKALDTLRRRRRTATSSDGKEEATSDIHPDLDLWRAVRALPDKQSVAVAHRYIADLPYRDIALVMGISEAAARQNVRAGLKNLKGDDRWLT